MDREEFFRQLDRQPFSVLSALVYQYIAEAIIEVRYLPGSRINTKRIAEELNISRTPVRTALERLAAEGLVKQSGEKGYKVAPVNWRDCITLYDVRGMLEGTSAYVSANTVTEDQIQQLRQNLQQCRTLVEKGDFPADIAAFNALDIRFHELIVRTTGNSYYISMFNRLKPWIERYTNAMVAAGSLSGFHPDLIVDKHTVIFRAIRSSYSMVAKSEMEDHLRHIYHVLLDGGLLSGQARGEEDER